MLDSDSDDSSSESVPPFVEDLHSDSDGLENWMVLGEDKQEGDQNIQLNLSLPGKDFTQPSCIYEHVLVLFL